MKLKYASKSSTREKRTRSRAKVGVKLSKKLAKAKGFGQYGHTDPPGPFKGGKKVKDDGKDKKKKK